MKTQRGFTLLELMITLVVIAILTAIALPSYTSYVTRGKIPAATSNLAAKRVQMEQWFQDSRTYLGAPACNNDTTGTPPIFTFSCTVQTATTYKIQATGVGTMAGFTYTVDQSNTQTSTIAAPAAPAWIATSNTCWITKPGGVC